LNSRRGAGRFAWIAVEVEEEEELLTACVEQLRDHYGTADRHTFRVEPIERFQYASAVIEKTVRVEHLMALVIVSAAMELSGATLRDHVDRRPAVPAVLCLIVVHQDLDLFDRVGRDVGLEQLRAPIVLTLQAIHRHGHHGVRKSAGMGKSQEPRSCVGSARVGAHARQQQKVVVQDAPLLRDRVDLSCAEHVRTLRTCRLDAFAARGDGYGLGHRTERQLKVADGEPLVRSQEIVPVFERAKSRCFNPDGVTTGKQGRKAEAADRIGDRGSLVARGLVGYDHNCFGNHIPRRIDNGSEQRAGDRLRPPDSRGEQDRGQNQYERNKLA
jgi:hypothetical protein